jgi:Colicin V production protein
VIIDIVIALVILGAAVIGYYKGFVQPLLAELFALGTLLLILRNRDGFAAAAQALFHASGVLAVVMAIVLAVIAGYMGARLGGAIHRMPAVRGVDGFLGVWMQVVVAVAFLYLLVSAVIVMGQAFNPVANATTANPAQVRTIGRLLGSNPITASMVGGAEMDRLDQLARRSSAVKTADLPLLPEVQSIYTDVLQPQLIGSRLAPWILRIGQHLPGLGGFGPADIPGKKKP